MNNSFGYYREVNGRLMCFATEAEYYEYVEELKRPFQSLCKLKKLK